MTCPACGVRVSADVVRDPDTGEELPCWWCPCCGCDLVKATTPDPSHHQ